MLRFPGCSKAFSLLAAIALVLPARAQGFFQESAPYDHLPSSSNTPVLPWVDGASAAFHDYAPPDVPESHPAHRLTVFKPDSAVANPSKRYPTVVFCTAGHFAQFPPQPSPTMGFLATARENGFVVVTVGTVGANSFPTCSQLQKCTPTGGVGTDPGCAPTTDCWDPNIFYDPDQPGSPWNDFNYFYGEKDLAWAMQYVRLRAADFQVDDARIVVSGTSTGAIYAGFVALGPERAWTDPILNASPQARLSTQVAGLVCFEPVVWHHAIPPTIPAPGSGFQPGLHWPTSDDPGFMLGVPYRTRCPVILDVPDSSFATASTSRLIRQYNRQVPVFLASGDGDQLSTGFGRNGNLATFNQDEDYDRWGSPSLIPFVPGDPTIDFPHGASVPETRLHDAWNIVIAAKDLELDQTDPPTFHGRYSRAFIGGNPNWNFWPASMTANGQAPNAVDPDLEQIPLLDGTYQPAGPSDGNPFLAPVVVQWMKRTFCVEGYPAVYCRNKGMNFPVLTGRTLVVGGSATITVNMREVPEVYDAAWLYAFGAPAEVPVIDGEYVLCADEGQGELLGLGIVSKDANGMAEFTIDVPNNTALEGVVFFTQARLYDLDGSWPDALTNAQDMVIQGF